MDLAAASTDRAYKLQAWIGLPRDLKPNAVNAVLRVIEEDKPSPSYLQTKVKGIGSARTGIINRGPSWWHDSYEGMSNIFSVLCITPRECQPGEDADVFKGLLGIFSGLFTAAEIGEKRNKERVWAKFRSLSSSSYP